MRGVITIDINERQKPGVNASITRFYVPGDVVNVVRAVFGDLYDSDDVWYLLNNGNYIWSGGVEIHADCENLQPEKRDHFLISYRQVNEDGKPNLSAKNPPDQLFFAPITLPADTETLRVNNLIAGPFADGVMKSMRNIEPARKHVFVYIHGYQLFSSLKMDLLSNFVMSHLTHETNAIAKILFFAWPAQGGPSRKTVDDRSIRAGQNFTAKNLFAPFVELKERLAKEGKFLNLLVHSFGHQLLNGMVNPQPGFENNIPKDLFENIFLMAPDVSQVTVMKGGKTIRNYFQDPKGEDYHYNFKPLQKLGKNVHIFHDKYDYLLYSSTKKFIDKAELKKASQEDRFKITADYRNLGNYGPAEIISEKLESGFNFFDIEKLVENAVLGDIGDFPCRDMKTRSAGRKVDAVWDKADYDGINATRIIFNATRFPNHHRYLFTCKPIVDKIQELLSPPGAIA